MTPFAPYACSLGTVIGHDAEAGAYLIRTPDGRVVGILANGELSPSNVEGDIANPRAPVAPVPAELTRYRFLVALRREWALTEGSIYALISQLPAGEPQETARDAFENASSFRRRSPLLLAAAQLSGRTEADIDALFVAAAAYTDLD